MATDYSIKIYRKADNKLLGETLANWLKTIFDSKFAEMINCAGGFSKNGVRFEYKDLENVENAAFKEIRTLNSEIFEKKLMICAAQNLDVKHELEDDIRYLEDDVSDYEYVAGAAAALQGAVGAMVEDIVRDDIPAYQYNCSDMPKIKGKYADGTEYEDYETIWNKDVYCVVESC